jgi:hypothetical protein
MIVRKWFWNGEESVDGGVRGEERAAPGKRGAKRGLVRNMWSSFGDQMSTRG